MRDDLKAALRSLLLEDLHGGRPDRPDARHRRETAIFSVVDAVVLRGLPFDEHDRLVAVGERRAAGPNPEPDARPAGSSSAIAPQNYLDWAAQQQVFESMAAIAGASFTLREPGAEPEDLRAQRVTAGSSTSCASGRRSAARSRPRTRSTATTASPCSATGSGAGASAAIPRSSAGRSRSKAAATRCSASCRPTSTYPIGAVRPTDLWVPYVVPAERAHPQSRARQLSTCRRSRG